ncbi:actin maturation protease [Haematobia irritans]|uniref:actin maturation protease n=1 Tax=Haematobia irritans TaxID=7368 RepID=UPI003F4FE24D
MSNTIPPPPTPPNILKCANNSIVRQQTPQLEECLWALDQPELQKACFLARICTWKKPKVCAFHNIESILQVGPTCGLTAISMLLGGMMSPSVLLNEAQQRHYTYNGEMFSAKNLYQLICDYLPIINNNNNNNNTSDGTLLLTNSDNGTDTEDCKAIKHHQHQTPIECQIHEGRLNCAKVKEALLQGACIFVPYDPDFNHSPCLKSGHKAHWALIIGYLITDDDEFFVIARHGKAKNLAVWSLQSLCDSNANLIEFAQPKGYPDCDFLLPPGGIGGDLGLRERAIIVKGLPLKLTTIS